MLTETNKAGIRTSLKQWSQRRNIPDEVLNDFIEIALTKANRALRIPPLEKALDVTIDGDGYFTLPSDFLEVKELTVVRSEKRIPLERKSIDEVDFVFDRQSGSPCFYGRFGDRIRLAPYSGDGTETARLYYYYVIPPMPADSTENWFTLQAPDMLLYGAMAELCSYTRDPEGYQQWTDKFNEQINLVQRMEDRAAWWSGGPIGISLGGSH